MADDEKVATLINASRMSKNDVITILGRLVVVEKQELVDYIKKVNE